MVIDELQLAFGEDTGGTRVAFVSEGGEETGTVVDPSYEVATGGVGTTIGKIGESQFCLGDTSVHGCLGLGRYHS